MSKDPQWKINLRDEAKFYAAFRKTVQLQHQIYFQFSQLLSALESGLDPEIIAAYDNSTAINAFDASPAAKVAEVADKVNAVAPQALSARPVPPERADLAKAASQIFAEGMQRQGFEGLGASDIERYLKGELTPADLKNTARPDPVRSPPAAQPAPVFANQPNRVTFKTAAPEPAAPVASVNMHTAQLKGMLLGPNGVFTQFFHPDIFEGGLGVVKAYPTDDAPIWGFDTNLFEFKAKDINAWATGFYGVGTPVPTFYLNTENWVTIVSLKKEAHQTTVGLQLAHKQDTDFVHLEIADTLKINQWMAEVSQALNAWKHVTTEYLKTHPQ